jgi:hypothetical protein
MKGPAEWAEKLNAEGTLQHSYFLFFFPFSDSFSKFRYIGRHTHGKFVVGTEKYTRYIENVSISDFDIARFL